jgi:uncharacterized protein (DUF1697 family)
VTRYVALLRAVNVGGTGKLPMSDLRALCETAGFENVRTYIASGNVVFDSDAEEAAVKATLEQALTGYAGKPVGAIVRTGAEMVDVLACNPFQNRVAAVFLDAPPPSDWRAGVSGLQTEELAAGTREIFVHYPDGQADTRLKMAAFAKGTARNLNTVAKLTEMAATASVEGKP